MKIISVPVLTLLMAMGVSLLAPTTVQAAVAPECNKGNILGIPPWYKYLNVTYDASTGCDVQLPKDANDRVDIAASVGPILLAVFEILLRIAGMVAVAFIIVGGFQYIFSQGEPDRTAGAKSTVLNALIGLAIAISATAVVNLIANSIT